MEIFSALLVLCAGNSPVADEFPSQRPVTPSLFSLICAWINDWVNNREAGELRRHWAHYAVTVMPRVHLCYFQIKFDRFSQFSVNYWELNQALLRHIMLLRKTRNSVFYQCSMNAFGKGSNTNKILCTDKIGANQKAWSGTMNSSMFVQYKY